MMLIEMARCDNPQCDSTGVPEHNPKPMPKKETYSSVYGWLQFDGWVVGSGPYFKIEVCSVNCIAPAIEAVFEEERRQYE